MKDLSWLIDRRLGGSRLIRRAFERAQDEDATREVRHAAIAVVRALDERLEKYGRARPIRDARDAVALALTRVRLEVLTAGDPTVWPTEEFEPREGEVSEFEKALTDAYASATEVFCRTLTTTS